ncbi:MAG TPA: hypothetical protein PKD66_15455 [Azonexus sp.]|nr:hypothetical protein [Azonexus sp.]
MEDSNQDKPRSLPQRTRGADRRCNTLVSSPPFYTREGKILSERRSPIDRRANWIREFSLDSGDNGARKDET